MDINLLKTFVTVARSSSINKASEILFLSQSTITSRLNKLELELGVTLLNRSSNGVLLTQEGHKFLSLALSIIDQVKEFQQYCQNKNVINILAGKAFVSFELPRLIGNFKKDNPSYSFYIKTKTNEEVIHSLMNNTSHMAILGYEVHHPQLVQLKLPSDEIVLVVSKYHKWADRFNNLSELENEDLIAYGDQTIPFRKKVDQFLAKNAINPHVVIELESVHAVKQMVLHNIGVSFLPKRTILKEIQDGSLVAHSVSDGQFVRPTFMVYNKVNQSNSILMNFIDWVLKHY